METRHALTGLDSGSEQEEQHDKGNETGLHNIKRKQSEERERTGRRPVVLTQRRQRKFDGVEKDGKQSARTVR